MDASVLIGAFGNELTFYFLSEYSGIVLDFLSEINDPLEVFVLVVISGVLDVLNVDVGRIYDFFVLLLLVELLSLLFLAFEGWCFFVVVYRL